MKGDRGDVCSRCVAVKIEVDGRKDAVEGEGKTSVVENKLRGMVEVKGGSSELLHSGYMDEDEEPEGTGDVLFLYKSKSVLRWDGRSFVRSTWRCSDGREHGDQVGRGSQTPFCCPESFLSLRQPLE